LVTWLNGAELAQTEASTLQETHVPSPAQTMSPPRALALLPRASALPPTRPVSIPVACGLLLALDAAALIAMAVAAYLAWLVEDSYSSITDYALPTAFGTLLAVNIFHRLGLYRPDISWRPWWAVQRLALGWIAAIALLLAIGYLTKTSADYSRGWTLLWLGFGIAALLCLRALFFAQARRWRAQGRLRRGAAIVGTGPFAVALAARLDADSDGGARVVGVYSDSADRVWASHASPYSGGLDELVDAVRNGAVDVVVLAASDPDSDRHLRTIERLTELPVDVHLCPGAIALRLPGCGATSLGGIPMLDVTQRPLRDWRCVAKDLEDCILGALILALIAPAMLAIAIAVKLDSPGPVFFRQRRYGFNHRQFEVLKFRTMRHELSDPLAESLTRRDDPRVTRLGALLRRWSLDELPQFINVLRGDMSIVGPRPHALAAKAGGILYQNAVQRYAARHRMKPGITGWAQVNGWRGATDTLRQIEQRVAHDLYYIENWSFAFDLKIILWTLFRGFGGRNAY
jgi:Undecaprenyl-phosphate glucose phosphotransferase